MANFAKCGLLPYATAKMAHTVIQKDNININTRKMTHPHGMTHKTNAKRYGTLLMVALIVLLTTACSTHPSGDFRLEGVWKLTELSYTTGRDYHYPNYEGRTYLKIYTPDSTFRICHVTLTHSSKMVAADKKGAFALSQEGKDRWLYRENGKSLPITVKDDSTIVIEEQGLFLTWQKTNDSLKVWTDRMTQMETSGKTMLSLDTTPVSPPKVVRRLGLTNHMLLTLALLTLVALCALFQYAVNRWSKR